MGARSIAAPVTFSILSNVIAFIPLLFIPGETGKFWWPVPVVVMTVLVISLLEALFILPSHLAHVERSEDGNRLFRWIKDRQAAFARRFDQFVQTHYSRALDMCLRNRYVTITAAIALLAVAGSYARSDHMGMIMMPEVSADEIEAGVRLPVGTTPEQAGRMALALTDATRRMYDEHNLETVAEGIKTNVRGQNFLDIEIVMRPPDERTMTAKELIELWRDEIGDVQGVDQITFEADDSGFLQAFGGGDLGVKEGRILSGSSTKFLSVVTGAQFASLAEPLLTGSVNNFKRLRSIGTIDQFSDSNRFLISANKMEFTITDQEPIPSKGIQHVGIDDVEGFFQDKRLAHLTNFQHLPPINRPTVDFPDGLPLGYYPRLGQQEIMTYEQLEADLIDRSWQTVEFRPTSRENNVVAQFFEAGSDALKKLDVIDFGSFLTKDEDRPEKRVFFVGKVFIDGTNVPTFVNLFTLVFE